MGELTQPPKAQQGGRCYHNRPNHAYHDVLVLALAAPLSCCLLCLLEEAEPPPKYNKLVFQQLRQKRGDCCCCGSAGGVVFVFVFVFACYAVLWQQYGCVSI